MRGRIGCPRGVAWVIRVPRCGLTLREKELPRGFQIARCDVVLRAWWRGWKARRESEPIAGAGAGQYDQLGELGEWLRRLPL